MRIRIRVALAAALVGAFFAGPLGAAASEAPAALTAQTGAQTLAGLTGRVVNVRGAGVPNAAVTVQGAGRTYSTQTNGQGDYTISLPPGVYTITVNHGGYQTASTEIAVATGTRVTANVNLVDANLSNLQVIGRTGTTARNNTNVRFNISSTSVGTIDNAQIEERNVPDLTPVVNEIPGVNVLHSASNPNQTVIVRGFSNETKDTLDGHPVSNGVGGSFLLNYMDAGVFQGVDVDKGMGLNGPTAGQSGVGTVNLRTLDFTAKNSAFVKGGVDQYGGTFYNLFIDQNVTPKLSVLLDRSFVGYNGPTRGLDEDAIDNADGTAVSHQLTYNYTSPYLTNNLVEFQGDFSNVYTLNAELAKLRYRFSDATSFQLGFLGLQGRFDPQGGEYGQFVGLATIPECLTGGKAASGAGCGLTSVYNAPSIQSQVGTSNVPVYTFYPGSDVRQNQPNFNAELKTTLGNDTIFFRPYTAAINRLIDGSGENAVAGNDGGWYEVTSPANCQTAFVAPAAGVGAKGPCYTAGESATGPAYITDTSSPHAFGTTPNAPSCSVATPCFTTPTAQDNSGVWGYGAPYTTLEVDKLFGYTFTYIHPVGANIFNLSFDHYYDDTQSFVNDFSPLVSGCTFVQGSTSNPPPGVLGNQPNCTLNEAENGGVALLKPTPIGVPDTFASISDLSLTAQFQLTPKIEFDWGNYFTHYIINAQVEDPALVAQYAAAYPKDGGNDAPISFITKPNSASHYDPHFGFVYRPSSDVALRATAGSSISIPYADQVSGLTKINQGASGTTLTETNPSLLPEEIVGYDLGGDFRFYDGTILSTDVYDDVIHNPWITTNTVVACPPGLENTPLCIASAQFNGPEEYSQGIEGAITHEPPRGWGYRATLTLDRTYYLNLPASFFATPQLNYNGEQLYGIPYAKGYAEVQWRGANETLARLGADYEGPGNEYNYFAFWTFDATAQTEIRNSGIIAQLTIENLTGANLGANLGQGVEYQGTVPVAAQIVNGNTWTYPAYSRPFGIIQPGFKSIRLSLSKKLY